MSESKTHERVRDVYTKVATRAREAEELEQHARSIGYSDEELATAPEGSNVAAGCGNPSAIDTLRPGESVVDLGSGAGMDAFLAARQVGPAGRVIGVSTQVGPTELTLMFCSASSMAIALVSPSRACLVMV